jgi:hypothetical protein
MKFERNINNLEEWEVDALLTEKEDWVALLELRQKKTNNNPKDLYAQEKYAEALILNKKYQETIDFLAPIYKKYYNEGFGISLIITALFGLGKTENDFNWLKKPNIFKLDKSTTDFCVKFLKGKRNFVRVFDFHNHILDHSDYMTFNEYELTDFLLMDTNTFDFAGEKDFWGLKMKMKKCPGANTTYNPCRQ